MQIIRYFDCDFDVDSIIIWYYSIKKYMKQWRFIYSLMICKQLEDRYVWFCWKFTVCYVFLGLLWYVSIHFTMNVWCMNVLLWLIDYTCSMLQELVDLDGYYLEREPCTTCNDPEIPYSNLKLNNIKVYIHPVTYPTGRKVL